MHSNTNHNNVSRTSRLLKGQARHDEIARRVRVVWVDVEAELDYDYFDYLNDPARLISTRGSVSGRRVA